MKREGGWEAGKCSKMASDSEPSLSLYRTSFAQLVFAYTHIFFKNLKILKNSCCGPFIYTRDIEGSPLFIMLQTTMQQEF
jgi:hypothetical protein